MIDITRPNESPLVDQPANQTSGAERAQVAIGILARNEEHRIGNLLADLARQSLLANSQLDISITIVANGCSDDTVQVARELLANSPYSGVKTAVHEVTAPGKANAWNEYVHNILPPTEFVFFLDADIRIPRDDALALVLDRLRQHPQAVVAVDRSAKDLEFRKPAGIAEWLIKTCTGSADDVETAIAGALYCVRYSAISSIWMPLGLPGEDGFLRAMLLTSSFAQDEDLNRHVYVREAYHVFESMRSAKDVYRHNIRLAIGTGINILLFWKLRRVVEERKDVASYIKERNLADPMWVNDLVRERLQRSYFPLQPKFLLRRFGNMRNEGILKGLLIASLGTIFDLAVFIETTRLMRKGAGAGYW